MDPTGNATNHLSPLTLIRSGGLPFAVLESQVADLCQAEEHLQLAERAISMASLSVSKAFDEALQTVAPSPLRTRVYQARQRFFAKQTLPAPGALSPLEDVEKACSELKNCKENFNLVKLIYEKKYEEACDAALKQLQNLAADPAMQHALLLASRDLAQRLPRFASADAVSGKKDRQTALALLRYLARTTAKTSPFGRWCGVGLPTESSDDLPDFARSRTLATPNVALLPALYQLLVTDPAFRNAQRIRLNPALTADGDTLYWLAATDGEERLHQVRSAPLLRFLQERLQAGALPWPELVQQTTAVTDGALPQTVETHLLKLTENGFLEWVWPVDGYSASWAGQLYNHLGFLPSSPLLTDVLNLLNWMRTAARILPHQSPGQIAELQDETLNQWNGLFSRWQSQAPPLSAEHLFFEDMEFVPEQTVPVTVLHDWRNRIKHLWESSDPVPRSELYRRMLACCDTFFPAADTVPFTVFCRTFVQNAAGLTPVPANEAVAEKRSFPFGALLQPYRDGNRWRAVINGLFPCGGKLTARWLHLFPAHVREHLETFHRNQNLRVFPWHGWFNANFQPSTLQAGVCMPGSRWPLRPEDTNLNQLMLRRQGTLLWVEDQPGRPLVFTDLGLEAPESKSTAVRLLYELTVPEVSVQALKGGVVWTEITEGLHHRPRLERGDLVVTREAWRVEENVWRYWIEGGKTPAEHYRHGTTALRALGVPRHFFYRFTGKKPQWVDSRHPLMVQLFEKDLRHGSGLLWLEEMLPTPGQAGARAWELVVDPI